MIPAAHVCSVALVSCALSGRRRHDHKDPQAQAAPLAAAGVANQQRTALPPIARSAQRCPVRAVAMARPMALQHSDGRQFATATALSVRPGAPCRDPCWPQAKFRQQQTGSPGELRSRVLARQGSGSGSKASSEFTGLFGRTKSLLRPTHSLSPRQRVNSHTPFCLSTLIWSQENSSMHA